MSSLCKKSLVSLTKDMSWVKHTTTHQFTNAVHNDFTKSVNFSARCLVGRTGRRHRIKPVVKISLLWAWETERCCFLSLLFTIYLLFRISLSVYMKLMWQQQVASVGFVQYVRYTIFSINVAWAQSNSGLLHWEKKEHSLASLICTQNVISIISTSFPNPEQCKNLSQDKNITISCYNFLNQMTSILPPEA